jgi:predicted Zn finger-like uncharacterized protein
MTLPPLSVSPTQCPHCGAKYTIVRVEAVPVARDREVTCLSCGGPLPAREGAFFMKYFLVNRPSKRQRRTG